MAKVNKAEKKAHKAAKKEKKRKLYRIANTAVALGLALAVAATVYLNSDYRKGKTTVVTVGGENITAREVNYFFRDSYDDFRSAYSDYLEDHQVIDDSLSLDKQEYSEDYSWAQFIYDASKASIIRTYVIYADAVKEGRKLTDEGRKAVDEQIEMLSGYAEKNNVSLDTFLRSFYGDCADEKSYREYLEIKETAESYSIDRYNQAEFSDEELDAYFEENYPDTGNEYDYPTVNCRAVFLKYDSTIDPLTGRYKFSDESVATRKKTAEDIFDLYMDGEQTEEAFIKFVRLYSENGSLKDGLYENLMKDDESVESAVRQWAFDETRRPGEVGIVEAEHGVYVTYWSKKDISAKHHTALTELRNEVWNQWYAGLEAAAAVTENGDVIKYLHCEP